jgi:autotransporter adhesin
MRTKEKTTMIMKTVLLPVAVMVLAATAINAHAAVVCTEVTRPNGTPALACKNVPIDEPAPGTSAGNNPVAIPGNNAPALPAVAITPAMATAASAAQVATLRNQVFEGIAQAAALAPLFPTAVGKTTANLGAASYGGQTAFALSIAHRPAHNLVFSAGLSAGPNSHRSLVQISAGFQF